MKKSPVLYSSTAVDNYISTLCYDNPDIEILVNECTLDGERIIFHPNGAIEVFEYIVLNCWSYAFKRHIYQKRLPKKWAAIIEKLHNEED